MFLILLILSTLHASASSVGAVSLEPPSSFLPKHESTTGSPSQASRMKRMILSNLSMSKNQIKIKGKFQSPTLRSSPIKFTAQRITSRCNIRKAANNHLFAKVSIHSILSSTQSSHKLQIRSQRGSPYARSPSRQVIIFLSFSLRRRELTASSTAEHIQALQRTPGRTLPHDVFLNPRPSQAGPSSSWTGRWPPDDSSRGHSDLSFL